jgi:NAD-dependent DNA ligase
MSYIKNGVEIEEAKKSTVKDGALLFVLTGPPGCLENGEKVTKEYYHDAIVRAGHQFASSYTKATNYLVTADSSSTSSKMEKARKNGTKIISHAELMKLIGQ